MTTTANSLAEDATKTMTKTRTAEGSFVATDAH